MAVLERLPAHSGTARACQSLWALAGLMKRPGCGALYAHLMAPGTSRPDSCRLADVLRQSAPAGQLLIAGGAVIPVPFCHEHVVSCLILSLLQGVSTRKTSGYRLC